MVLENDQTIVERTKSGDRNAYAVLVDRYSGPIFNLAFRMTHSREDASDLAQDAFIRAYESLGSFDEARRFFPWLYAIALNGIRNHLRRTKMTSSMVSTDQWDAAASVRQDSPEEAAIARQDKEEMGRWVQQLPLNLKEAVALRYYQDLAFDDIADILNISLSAAKMRVYRGLDNLKSLMAEDL